MSRLYPKPNCDIVATRARALEASTIRARLLRSLGPRAIGLAVMALTGALASPASAQACPTSWTSLGEGLSGGVVTEVNTLVTMDIGSGPALFVGGVFDRAGGVAVSNVARWDGAQWSALGLGLSSRVWAMAVHDDGRGPALYAGGQFSTASGTPARRVARWDGTSWEPLGSGIAGSGTFTAVTALASFDDGSGPALFAGGEFNEAGGVAASNIAKWQGGQWLPLGEGVDGLVRALTVFDDGTGPALYAGGSFENAGGAPAAHIARWDGTRWEPLAEGVNDFVNALAVFDDGSGPALYAGGRFIDAGGLPARYLARWDGRAWSALGAQVNNSIRALVVHDDGDGEQLYAGGLMTLAGGVPVGQIARWDGDQWSALDSGVSSVVETLATYQAGPERALFAGGIFTQAGGADASRIARWGCPPLQRETRAVFASQSGTIQPGGPRLPPGGDTFFNIQGFVSGGTSFASYGVLRWDLSDLRRDLDALFPGGWTVEDIALELTQSNAFFSQSGRINVFFTTDDRTDAKSPSSPLFFPFFDFSTVPARPQMPLGDPDPILSYTYIVRSTGAVDRYDRQGGPLGSAERLWLPTSLAEKIETTNQLTLVFVDDEDPFVAATYRGQTPAAGVLSPRLEISVLGQPVAVCRADIDGDGLLTIFDFLAFQNLFAMGDLAADFDGDGQLTIFDFLAFQNEFALGCP
ncbi:MAG: hypothetical protein KIT54_07615 [Phycisphaeraceae bacterium]|nr:hypothetical protein [Phycisphaeraceae bacterium]